MFSIESIFFGTLVLGNYSDYGDYIYIYIYIVYQRIML